MRGVFFMFHINLIAKAAFSSAIKETGGAVLQRRSIGPLLFGIKVVPSSIVGTSGMVGSGLHTNILRPTWADSSLRRSDSAYARVTLPTLIPNRKQACSRRKKASLNIMCHCYDEAFVNRYGDQAATRQVSFKQLK